MLIFPQRQWFHSFKQLTKRLISQAAQLTRYEWTAIQEKGENRVRRQGTCNFARRGEKFNLPCSLKAMRRMRTYPKRLLGAQVHSAGAYWRLRCSSHLMYWVSFPILHFTPEWCNTNGDDVLSSRKSESFLKSNTSESHLTFISSPGWLTEHLCFPPNTH